MRFVFGKLNNLHEKRVNLKRRFASVLTDLVNFIVFSRRLKLRQADVNFTQNILITSHFCYLASKLRAISTVKCVQISRGEFKIGEFLIIQINRCSFEPNDLKTFTSVCLCFKNTFEKLFWNRTRTISERK